MSPPCRPVFEKRLERAARPLEGLLRSDGRRPDGVKRAEIDVAADPSERRRRSASSGSMVNSALRRRSSFAATYARAICMGARFRQRSSRRGLGRFVGADGRRLESRFEPLEPVAPLDVEDFPLPDRPPS